MTQKTVTETICICKDSEWRDNQSLPVFFPKTDVILYRKRQLPVRHRRQRLSGLLQAKPKQGVAGGTTAGDLRRCILSRGESKRISRPRFRASLTMREMEES